MGREETKLTNNEVLEFLYSLLFKDINSKPYSDECSQNILVRKQAKKWGFDLIKYEKIKQY